VIYFSSQGNLPDLAAAGSFYEYMQELHQQYGDIVSFWLGKEYTISIASPELFKQHNHVFDRPREFSQHSEDREVAYPYA